MFVYKERVVIKGILIVIGSMVILAFLLNLRYNFVPFYPHCIFHQMTGWYCPGCGNGRALRFIVHGEFYQAFRMNPFSFFIVPILVYEILALKFQRVPRLFFVGKLSQVWVIVIVLYWIMRNLPSFHWIAPTIINRV